MYFQNHKIKVKNSKLSKNMPKIVQKTVYKNEQFLKKSAKN